MFIERSKVIGLPELWGTFRAYKQIIRGLVGLSRQEDPPTLPACPHHLSLLLVIKSLGAHAKAKVSDRAKPLNKHQRWFNDVCTHCKKAMIFWAEAWHEKTFSMDYESSNKSYNQRFYPEKSFILFYFISNYVQKLFLFFGFKIHWLRCITASWQILVPWLLAWI